MLRAAANRLTFGALHSVFSLKYRSVKIKNPPLNSTAGVKNSGKIVNNSTAREKLAREARRKFWTFLADTKGETLQKRSKKGYFRSSKNGSNLSEIFVNISTAS